MKHNLVYKTALKVALVSVAGLMVACSSSGSSSTDASISGTIVAAPVDGADVSVVDVNGNVVVEAVKTNANGQYALTIPNGSLAQDLIIKSTGGTFTDEATGNGGTAGEMYAYASANSLSNGDTVCATPGSTIIAHLVMNHSKTMAQAQEAFANAFGYTPDMSVTPADATTAPAAEETAESTLAGFRAAAFSQLAMDLLLSQDDQFELFAALARDLSDDKLDGVDASGAVAIGATGSTLEADIQNRFSMALVNFRAAEGYNLTGLNDAQIGNLPFGKVALTSSYKVEYIEGMMPAMEGKTKFKLRISDAAEAPVSEAVTLMTMMYMAEHKHSSPDADCVESATAGEYDCTVYYLMASQMMDGTSMGYWELTVMTGGMGGETATFYPMVKMTMGDTAKTKVKAIVDLAAGSDLDGDGINDIASLDGIADLIINMMGDFTNRNYFIFKDSLAGTGPYTFTMFIAAMESMKSYPALKTPSTLMSGMGGTPLNVTGIDVNVSVNGGASLPANDNGDGTWDISLDLNDLEGEVNELEVELLVNGERKTSSGTADGLNSIFSITPTPAPAGM